MKYDTLGAYREYLATARRFRPDTIRTYYNRLDHLLEGQSLTHTVEKLDIAKIIENLSKITYKNHFSQSKNALLHFLAFLNISIRDEHLEEIEKLERNTRKKYRSLKKADFKEIDKKIKYLKNKKLKLSYQVMIETGLRVFEVAQITPNDCTISNDEIQLSFIGKGGKKEEVIILKKENPTLYENIKEKTETTKKADKMFYSAIYLQKEAQRLGITCHNLRRAYAKLEYKKTKSREDVRKKLRHTNIKTTNIYLRSKIKV